MLSDTYTHKGENSVASALMAKINTFVYRGTWVDVFRLSPVVLSSKPSSFSTQQV